MPAPRVPNDRPMKLEYQMRFVPLCVIFLGFATTGFAQNVVIDPKNQTITADMQTLLPHIVGRVQAQPLPAPLPAGALSYSHEWPAVYFEAAFEGSQIFLKFNDSSNEYRVLIDDLPSIAIAQPGASEITIGGLSLGQHAIRLEKVTESSWIVGAFDGFYLPSGAKSFATAPKPRQIEFIGDSDMTGYGIRSTTRTCTQDEVRLLSDAQIAYPALLAKALRADYQVNAISGRGMIRNYGGGGENSISAVYANILPDLGPDAEQTPYLDQSWQPQIIVVALGDNDFSTPLLPSEKWPSNTSLIDDFETSTKDFLTTLHHTNPNAALILVQFDGTILTDAEKQRLTSLQISGLPQMATAIGFRSVDTVSMAAQAPERSACDYHASKADQQRRADWLAAYISARPALWQGMGD